MRIKYTNIRFAICSVLAIVFLINAMHLMNSKSTYEKRRFLSNDAVHMWNSDTQFNLHNASVVVSLTLQMDNKEYFSVHNRTYCLKDGSSLSISKLNCTCLTHWHGVSCNIPTSVYHASRNVSLYKIRKIPRRIVQAFLFNNEWEMLEYRLSDTSDIVDAFLILESNYTGYGDPKETLLGKRLREGYFPKQIAQKIVYVFLDYFPEDARSDGWLYDDTARNYLCQRGVKQQLQNYSNDDIFILTDADEVPSRDVLLFLKLHDGIQEPFGFGYKKTAYGFFWDSGYHIVYQGITFGMLQNVLKFNCSKIRSNDNPPMFISTLRDDVWKFEDLTGLKVRPHVLGTPEQPAGVHCSYCTSLLGIRTKLISAINADFPRWGDYPEKCQLPFLKNLISLGLTFDETTCLKPHPQTTEHFAPVYFLRNKEKYHHLLGNIYVTGEKCWPRKPPPERIFLKNWHRLDKRDIARLLVNGTIPHELYLQII